MQRLRECLTSPGFDSFRFAVAYAKSGPLLRLDHVITQWRAQGKAIHATFGLDQKGTSEQALRYALDHFDSVVVTFAATATFHPKAYMFSGTDCGVLFVGSNNMTVGGLEQNFETCIELIFALPQEEAAFEEAKSIFTSLEPEHCAASVELDEHLFAQLKAADLLAREGGSSSTEGHKQAAKASGLLTGLLGNKGFTVAPPSPLPKNVMKPNLRGGTTQAGAEHKGSTRATRPKPRSPASPSATAPEPVTPVGLAIQIVPHHNGEVFLSKTAVNQNPAFFGWPFTGKTTPKQGDKNQAYPQRTPDPVVNIVIVGDRGNVKLSLDGYELNTVYYEKKGEIRITAGPIVEDTPAHSIMVMRQSDADGVDYDLIIHRPDSPEYSAWLSLCNQKMPSGGASNPRRFGWF
ncbi:MAG TPA: phospholipase D family protein [Gammaproteobacteria bacterium]|nr:phospholipase D family protein [Gammaproteobacteria bacterium]